MHLRLFSSFDLHHHRKAKPFGFGVACKSSTKLFVVFVSFITAANGEDMILAEGIKLRPYKSACFWTWVSTWRALRAAKRCSWFWTLLEMDFFSIMNSFAWKSCTKKNEKIFVGWQTVSEFLNVSSNVEKSLKQIREKPDELDKVAKMRKFFHFPWRTSFSRNFGRIYFPMVGFICYLMVETPSVGRSNKHRLSIDAEIIGKPTKSIPKIDLVFHLQKKKKVHKMENSILLNEIHKR